MVILWARDPLRALVSIKIIQTQVIDERNEQKRKDWLAFSFFKKSEREQMSL